MTATGSTYRTALDAVLRESTRKERSTSSWASGSCGGSPAVRLPAPTPPGWPRGPSKPWRTGSTPTSRTASPHPHPARHAYLLARALAFPPERDEALVSLRTMWADSGLLSANAAPGPVRPSGRGLDAVPESAAARLDAVLERIPHLPGAAALAPDSMLVAAALLMAGCEPGRWVQIPVVFGAAERPGEPGATGVLELREFPAGPPGLYPDPRYMTGLRSSDGQFATALGRAWAVAGRCRGRAACCGG
ncbi:hypothetical protein ACFQ3Z_04630 [Streptomyces nogalater]